MPVFKKVSTVKVLGKEVDVIKLRKQLELNQRDFWAKLGVTQSGGSRYENGCPMPLPVQKLFDLGYIKQVDFDLIHKDDIAVIEHLRITDRVGYKELIKKTKVKKIK